MASSNVRVKDILLLKRPYILLVKNDASVSDGPPRLRDNLQRYSLD